MYFNFNTLFFLTELVGTVSFSISGATHAVKQGFDLFGIVFLGVLTAIGGGLIRDALLGQVPPKAFLNNTYLVCAAATSLLVFTISYLNHKHFGHFVQINDNVLNFFDAVGLGIFSVVGVQNAISSGFESNLVFCIFLGMTTGIGGGILRDLFSCCAPIVLRKRIYALASLAGALCYYCLHMNGISGSIITSVTLVISIRLLSRYYHWKLPKINNKGFHTTSYS